MVRPLSSFDIVAWFTNRALNDGEYLQPAKLHRVLFLAQAYYAVAFRGKRLLPTSFIADNAGPVAPDIYRVLASPTNFIEPIELPEKIEEFLDSIWRRFGSHTADFLGRQIVSHPPFALAMKEGVGTEITLESMLGYYGSPLRSTQLAGDSGAPPLSHVLRPKVMRSQDGKPVSVQRWMPPAAPAKK